MLLGVGNVVPNLVRRPPPSLCFLSLRIEVYPWIVGVLDEGWSFVSWTVATSTLPFLKHQVLQFVQFGVDTVCIELQDCESLEG